MQEIWKDIPELKGKYQASNFGRIRSMDHYIKSNFHNCEQVKRKGKIIKQFKGNYYCISINENGKTKEIKEEDLLKMKDEEFCIMPDNPPYWRNFRFSNNPYECQRHEVWEGRTGNRDKSIEDGLVIFTTPQLHLYDRFSIHKSHKEWEKKTQMQRISVKVWCEYYNKTEENFRERFGRLPL